MLRLASDIKQYSEHYMASGLLKKAKGLGVHNPKSEKFNYLPGKALVGLQLKYLTS